MMISFLSTGSPSLSACPSSVGTPRKEVVCFYEGKRPLQDLTPCLCTHLVYTDVGLNDHSQLDIEGRAKSRRSNLRLLSGGHYSPAITALFVVVKKFRKYSMSRENNANMPEKAGEEVGKIKDVCHKSW